MNPSTATLKELIAKCAEIKRGVHAPGSKAVPLFSSDAAFCLEVLRLAHPDGASITDGARICVAKKPLNCERCGTSETCFWVSVDRNAFFVPVWFADCRASIRKERLAGGSEVAVEASAASPSLAAKALLNNAPVAIPASRRSKGRSVD